MDGNLKAVVISLTALAFGGGLLAGGELVPPRTVERVVTVQAPAPTPEVRTVTQTVAIAPRACVAAIDQLIGLLDTSTSFLSAMLDEDAEALAALEVPTDREINTAFDNAAACKAQGAGS